MQLTPNEACDTFPYRGSRPGLLNMGLLIKGKGGNFLQHIHRKITMIDIVDYLTYYPNKEEMRNTIKST